MEKNKLRKINFTSARVTYFSIHSFPTNFFVSTPFVLCLFFRRFFRPFIVDRRRRWWNQTTCGICLEKLISILMCVCVYVRRESVRVWRGHFFHVFIHCVSYLPSPGLIVYGCLIKVINCAIFFVKSSTTYSHMHTRRTRIGRKRFIDGAMDELKLFASIKSTIDMPVNSHSFTHEIDFTCLQMEQADDSGARSTCHSIQWNIQNVYNTIVSTRASHTHTKHQRTN